MASQVTTTAPGDELEALQTSGRVLAGREVTVEQDQEICVRGTPLMTGYWRGRKVDRALDENGWFHTGDLGHWDATGRLVVMGRRDNLFVSGGENIYPEEIELELLNLPGVHNAVVVPVTSDEYGQRPIAFIEGDLDQEQCWRAALADHLPRFKIPDCFFAWPPSTGLKPNRNELQRLAEQTLDGH